MANGSWKWTETPQYELRCESLVRGDNGSGPIQTDVVKTAIEENVLLDPIAGSKPFRPEGHPNHDPSIRRITVEPAPELGIARALLVVFRIEDEPADPSEPREVTGLEIGYDLSA
jgi:hypothetical protein